MKKPRWGKAAWRRFADRQGKGASQWRKKTGTSPAVTLPADMELSQTGTRGEPAAVVVAEVQEPNMENEAGTVMDNEVKDMETSTVTKTQTTGRGRYSNTAASTTAPVARPDSAEKPRSNAARRAGRDLQSGLELLELDFLLGIVENTEAVEDQDVTMRKLGFSELVRTNRVHEIDSNALKAYAMDAEAHFGKEIQVEAFKELAERTSSNAGK